MQNKEKIRRKNLKLTIEYDGTNYAGWQIQQNANTIQGEIEKVLATIFQTDIRITGSGRTDTGVHALNQIAHFTCPNSIGIDQLKKKLNSLLPDDIAIKDINAAAGNFHARFDAKLRKYKYIIARKKKAVNRYYSWYVPQDLDIEAMKKTLSYLEGEMSFKSLAKKYPEEISYLCKIEDISLTCTDEEIVLSITANRFLRSMVRIITGILVKVGKGTFKPEDIKTIIENEDCRYKKYLAPAKGLFLEAVLY